MNSFDVRGHKPVFDPRSSEADRSEEVQESHTGKILTTQQITSANSASSAHWSHLFDLLDYTAHKFIDLLQRSGGTQRAEELNTLTGSQQLYGKNCQQKTPQKYTTTSLPHSFI